MSGYPLIAGGLIFSRLLVCSTFYRKFMQWDYISPLPAGCLHEVILSPGIERGTAGCCWKIAHSTARTIRYGATPCYVRIVSQETIRLLQRLIVAVKMVG
jgi:hypothetical protein